MSWSDTFKKASARKKAGKKPFTNVDLERAENWNTCAFGESMHVFAAKLKPIVNLNVTRDSNDQPSNWELNDLGGDFYTAVIEQDLR